MKPTGPVTIPRSSLIQIHIAVVLFGFTAILGDLIQLPAVVLVWWRVLITSISLLLLTRLGTTLFALSVRQRWTYAGIGVLIGLHWICFYGSVKLSNASICLLCMSTTSFFTSLLEPLLLRTKYNPLEMLLGVVIVPAMVMIVQDLDGRYVPGITAGLLSALLAAIFSILNKKYISGADSPTISLIELSSAWGMISLLLLGMWSAGNTPSAFIPPSVSDWVYIGILSLACTTLAQILTLKALRHMSAYAANLAINLEPVYGILLAAVLLGDHQELSTSFYIGAAIIVGTVLAYPVLTARFSPQNQT